MSWFPWARKARDHVKNARSDATQAQRLFSESAIIMRDLEHHLARISSELPPQMHNDAFRQLELQIDLTRRHATRMRAHIQRLEAHVESVDKRLAAMRAQKAA